jgi:hypothetical protein
VDAPELKLEARAAAYLHDADSNVVAVLRDAVASSSGSHDVYVLGRDEVEVASSPEALAVMLAAEGLEPLPMRRCGDSLRHVIANRGGLLCRGTWRVPPLQG